MSCADYPISKQLLFKPFKSVIKSDIIVLVKQGMPLETNDARTILKLLVCFVIMSDSSTSLPEFGLDSQGRVIRVDPNQNRPILRLPTAEETLRRLGNSFNSSQSMSDIYNETSETRTGATFPEEDTSRDTMSNMTDTELSVDVADGSSSPNQTTESAPTLSLDDDRKYCWVCFATDEDDATASWVKPCHCRGTTKWVHQGCIQRWVDVKQKGRAGEDVSCPQCNTEYIIIYPDMGPLVVILDTMDSVIFRVCPFIAAGIVVGSIYWTAVTYGAVTVMQVVGHKDGMTMMEQADPLVLLVGLPTIPIMLVLGKMLRWEDQALSLLRRHACKVPILRHFLPSSYIEDDRTQSPEVPPMSDPVSATRVLCSALLLPTIASICGKIFFESVNSNFQRTLLGGIAFITIKGAFKIYHKQQQYVRQCQRRIMDYTDNNIALYRGHQNGESIIS